MAKVKTPLSSFRASGPIGDVLSYDNRLGQRRVRTKPLPFDRQTLLQMYHRWDYQDYCAQWQTLTNAEKQTWETNARRLRITGFNYYIRTKLTTLPDIVARYHLDSKSSGLTLDTSKNVNHAAVLGATVTPGVVDAALFFDGVDDHLRLPYIAALNLTDIISLDCFIYQHDLITWRSVYGRDYLGAGDKGPFVATGKTANSHPWIQLQVAGVWKNKSCAVLDLPSGSWHYFYFGFQRPTLTFQVDDTTEVLTFDQPLPDTNRGSYIARFRGEFLHGDIDHWTLYNRLLTPTDRLRHSQRRYPL